MAESLGRYFYYAVKNTARCLVCDTAETIQFHHVIPEIKTAEVPKLAKSATFQTVVDEFNKCVPVCDRHHREIHRGQRQGWLKGQFDNGRYSHMAIAVQYMPYLPWFFARNPEVLRAFYRDHLADANRLVRSLGPLNPLRPSSPQSLEYSNVVQMSAIRGPLYGVQALSKAG